jgi:hypothetical protein
VSVMYSRYFAYMAVAKALRDGTIERPGRCSRCNKRCSPDGHHEDYSKPLDLVWLCKPCHRRHHYITETGFRGRPRCVGCNRLVYRHTMENGGAVQSKGAWIHNACKKLVQVRREKMAILAASSSATAEPTGDVAGTQVIHVTPDSRKDDLSTSEEGAT